MGFEQELSLAIEAARKAGSLLRQRSAIEVYSQAGRDIKISSDRKSEAVILECLAQTGYPILSEETGPVSGSGELYWIVDPLDGTLNYWRGMRELACTSVALWDQAGPVLGVIYRFETDELYTGVVGQGASCNGEPIHPSQVGKLCNGVVGTGFPTLGDFTEESIIRRMKQLLRFKKIRLLGTAALSGAFVAQGKLDVYMEEKIMLWDIAASAAIVLASGGIVEIERMDEYKCLCRYFANRQLQEDFHAEIV